MNSNKQVVYQAIGVAKGQSRNQLLSIVVFVAIFVVLVAGVKYSSGALGTQPVNVAQTKATAGGDATVTPTVFTPPEANYEKTQIEDLMLRKSSYTVCCGFAWSYP